MANSMAVSVGLIGALGDMARLYIRRWMDWHVYFFVFPYFTDLRRLDSHSNVHVHACDHPSKRAELDSAFADLIQSGRLTTHKDGHGVSRSSDVIIYSVESSNIVQCIKTYAPSTKLNAIVAGQTSVKAQEIRAFEEHMPEDVSIISLHSMHGPSVSTKGQPLVLIPHRVVDREHLSQMRALVLPFESKIIEIPWKTHDDITADTQAVTHVAFLSMGAAWSAVGIYPWFSAAYNGNTLVEKVKVAIAMRIYFSKWHVYAGLAVLNESARGQIRQFAKSARELFELMIQEKEEEFTERVMAAAKAVFGGNQTPLLHNLLQSEDDAKISSNGIVL